MTPKNSHNLIKGLENLSVGLCGAVWGREGLAGEAAQHCQVEGGISWAASHWHGELLALDLWGPGMAVGAETAANVRGFNPGERNHFHPSDEHSPCSATPAPPVLHLLF